MFFFFFFFGVFGVFGVFLAQEFELGVGGDLPLAMGF